MRFDQDKSRPRLLNGDMTSMVDLVFLLIIFFLTTSTFIEKTRARVDLPEEEGEELQEVTKSSVIINITRNGTYVVAGEYLSLDEILSRVDAELASVGGEADRLDLLIRADRDASLVHLNDLAERLIERNVRSWKLGTAVPRGSSPGGGGAAP